MLKTFSKILLPALLVFLAFSFGGAALGLITVIVLFVYFMYRYLPEIYITMARYQYMKDNEKMFAFFERAYKTGRMKTDHKIYYAYMCMREGRMEKAERMFNAVLAYKQPPDILARARTNYALFLWKTGKLRDAVELMEQVYEVYKSSVVYANYGYLLLESGDLQKALKINLEAYDYDGANDIIADNLAQNYYLLGDLQKSREIHEISMERKPKFPIPYYNYAKLLYALGEKSKAAEMLKTSLQYPFSGLAAVTKEEVERFLLMVEKELDRQIEEENL